MQECVLIDYEDNIAHVRLNRPEKMNALNADMFAAIIAAGDELKRNTALRAVVLSGNGRAFCAGLDMESIAGTADGNGSKSMDALAPRTHGIANHLQYVSWLWRELPVPVIAALHGVAFGGGCQITIGADIRYAAADTRLSIMETKWGLVPDMGATPFIHKLLRDDVLRELVYSSRIIDAAEAQALGLVTRVCDDPLAAALETAREIALKNPDAIRAAKRLLNNAPFQQPAEILLAESVEQERLIGSPNQVEAVKANFEKRTPNYTV